MELDAVALCNSALKPHAVDIAFSHCITYFHAIRLYFSASISIKHDNVINDSVSDHVFVTKRKPKQHGIPVDVS